MLCLARHRRPRRTRCTRAKLYPIYWAFETESHPAPTPRSPPPREGRLQDHGELRRHTAAGPTQGAAPACSAGYDSDMKAGVGVTDAQWAAFLRDRPHLREANFWVPNPRPTWRVADRGSAWLFKTRWPANQIVGAGFVSGYARLRVSEAWEFFGEGNGVASEAALLTAIQRYRKDRDPDPLIGCV